MHSSSERCDEFYIFPNTALLVKGKIEVPWFSIVRLRHFRVYGTSRSLFVSNNDDHAEATRYKSKQKNKKRVGTCSVLV